MSDNETLDHDDPYESPADEPDSFALIRRVIEIVETARPLPLSSSVRIEPGEVLEILDDAVARMPEEIRKARWLLKERNEFLAKVHAEGDLILDEARTRAARMVERQEIVRQARITATQTIQDSEDDARRRRHEAEDWCDRHLAKFEIQLGKVNTAVSEARNQLRSIPLADATPNTRTELASEEAANAFFDQDHG
jgi:hypothetical protein